MEETMKLTMDDHNSKGHLLVNGMNDYETAPLISDSEILTADEAGVCSDILKETFTSSVVLKYSSTPNRRLSIFTENALSEIESVAGGSFVDNLTSTPLGYVLQTMLFVFLSLIVGLSPAFCQFALWDPVQGKKVADLIPQSPFVIEFLIASILANVLSFFNFGTEGLKRCWNPRQILHLSPISVLHGCSEAVELIAMLYLDSGLRAVLNQLKLPIISLIRRIFMNEKRTLQQWLMILSITLAVWGFIISDVKSQISLEKKNEILGPGLLFGLTSIGFSIGASTVADVLMKKANQRYIIQMAQIRSTSLIVMLILMVIYAWIKEELWKIPIFYGWNYRVVILTGWLLLKDFTMIYVLKRLDSFWPALASSAGLVVAFGTDLAFFGEPFKLISFVFIWLVALLIISYSIAPKSRK